MRHSACFLGVGLEFEDGALKDGDCGVEVACALFDDAVEVDD